MIALPEKHLQQILSLSIRHQDTDEAVIVFDRGSALAGILADAYKRCLPNGRLVDFDQTPPEEILNILRSLKAPSLAVLVQSSSFRLDAFRIRLDLFSRGVKVIEHPHLANIEEAEIPYYLDSLAYDADYYQGTGARLKTAVDSAQSALLETEGGQKLYFASPFEDAKLNVGDYSTMKNTGGQFPIGEVFTEARTLEAVNGQVALFAFGNASFRVCLPEKPITLVVEEGRVRDALRATPEFDAILRRVREEEGQVWLRELGLGLNRAFTRERIVTDIGTYERMCGIHLSLGAKHTIYKKPQFTRSISKNHIDLFAATTSFSLDEKTVYENGRWLV